MGAPTLMQIAIIFTVLHTATVGAPSASTGELNQTVRGINQTLTWPWAWHNYACDYLHMQWIGEILQKCRWIFVSDQQEPSNDHREISYPSLVNSRGQHISYDIHRLLSEATADARTYFKLEVFGKKYLLNVSSSSHFVHSAPNVAPVVEYIGADGSSRIKMMNHSRHCFHSGYVHLMGDLDASGTNLEKEVPVDGWVAMSSCLGLVSAWSAWWLIIYFVSLHNWDVLKITYHCNNITSWSIQYFCVHAWWHSEITILSEPRTSVACMHTFGKLSPSVKCF